MDFKETLANLFRALRPHERSLENTLDAAWRAQIAGYADSALALLDRALEIARSAPMSCRGRHPATPQRDLRRSGALRRRRPTAARALLDGARGDTQRSYIHSMIGVLAQARGDASGARTAFEKALELARRARSPAAEGRARSSGRKLSAATTTPAAPPICSTRCPELATAGDAELNSSFTGSLQAGDDPERADQRRSALAGAGAACRRTDQLSRL
ncbi:MAG: hypothetical protein U0703_11450 [Anaerolineae bacterium]